MSMGANLMLRVAGEEGVDFPLKAMVSLNNPFDLWLAINLMRNTPYERNLANELKSQIFFKPQATETEMKIFAEIQEIH